MQFYKFIITIYIFTIIYGVYGKKADDQFIVTFKNNYHFTFPQFMNQLKLEDKKIYNKLKKQVTGTFHIGKLSGFHSKLSPCLYEIVANHPSIESITPNYEFDMVSMKPQGEEDEDYDRDEEDWLMVQEGAPRHLARIGRREKLPFKFREFAGYKNKFHYYYNQGNQGTGVKVYVLDTGVDITHPEFEGRATFGADTTLEGHEDLNGHGTHVAGLVGSKTFGVAKNVSIVSVKCLFSDGHGTLRTIINAIDWAYKDCLQSSGTTKCVVNMSLGSLKEDLINDAINEADAQGVVFVVAAGNANMDSCFMSPASATGAITVGAFDDRFDSIAFFSNHGKCVDIFAPGVSIHSLASRARYNRHPKMLRRTPRRLVLSGTSMASPIVCGLVALLMEEGYTSETVRQELVDRSTPDVFSPWSMATRPHTPNRIIFTGLDTDNYDTVNITDTTSTSSDNADGQEDPLEMFWGETIVW